MLPDIEAGMIGPGRRSQAKAWPDEDLAQPGRQVQALLDCLPYGAAAQLSRRVDQRPSVEHGKRRDWSPLNKAGCYRPDGNVIVTGATSGLPTSSWIRAWAFSGMSRGFASYR